MTSNILNRLLLLCFIVSSSVSLATESPIDSTKEVSFYDTSSIYTNDWKVNITFAYEDKSYAATQLIKFTDSTHSYSFPIEKKMTSPFGKRGRSFHKGVDIPLHTGEKIVAAFDGKVRYATYNNGGFGRLIIIRHTNGLETYYAHLSKIKVKPNQIVKAGELIGLGGSTGRSYSPHLHFEVRFRDKPINPENIFDAKDFCLLNEEAMVGELILKKGHKSHIHAPALSDNFLAKGTIYSIKSGDTLYKIAARNGTSINALCALNGMDRSSTLHIGQKIRVN
tara:strand:- start:3131 stop:3970 length:840 start_codon:yes stop_codon:yes gene_type:complete